MTPSQRINKESEKTDEKFVNWNKLAAIELISILDEMDARISRLENKGLPENISLNHD